MIRTTGTFGGFACHPAMMLGYVIFAIVVCAARLAGSADLKSEDAGWAAASARSSAALIGTTDRAAPTSVGLSQR